MTVKEAIDFLAKCDQAAVLVMSSYDHSLVGCHLEKTTLRHHDGNLTEDHGEEHTPTEEYGPPIPCILVT